MTHQLWPLTTGARLRDYYFARELARRAEVTVMEMLLPGENPSGESVPGRAFTDVLSVRRDSGGYNLVRIVRGMAGPIPLTVLNYHSEHTAAHVSNVLRSKPFDAVQIESVHLSPYIPAALNAPSRPAVLNDWHNVESELMSRYAAAAKNPLRRIVAQRTARLLEHCERTAAQRSHGIAVPSERERDSTLARMPGVNVHAVGNGVDTAHFAACAEEQAREPGRGNRQLLYVGSMDYHANVDAVEWFVSEVWPALAQRHADLRFTIVGRNPSAAIRALASERIHVTGTVEDVRDYYRDAAAVVVPLRVGSGTRLKVLEAMAAGVPVISTRLGSEGIDVTDGEHLVFADDPLAMVHAVSTVLSSPEKRSRLREDARTLVRNVYDWETLGKRLYGIHEQLQSLRPSHPGRSRAGSSA